MAAISIFVSILFILTTILTSWFFYKAAGNSTRILSFILAWSVFQSIISLLGFYQDLEAIPPRFPISIAPGILLIIILFISKAGRRFIDALNIKRLTILHVIRLPVEITLLHVFIAGLIPRSMTFEGNNFDILSGISAPVIYYFVFIAKKANRKVLLGWNIICLGLLINILTIAILSAKTPFQQLAFDQPNIGVGYFPFILLPSVVVPIVLLAQIAAIRQLVKNKSV